MSNSRSGKDLFGDDLGGANFRTSAEGLSNTRGGKNPRFIGVSDGKEVGWHSDENIFAILPPFSNWFDQFLKIKEEASAKGEKPVYPIGQTYEKLAVRSYKDKFPRAYRVKRDNPLSSAWQKIFDELSLPDAQGKRRMTEELKKIQGGLGGWPEFRTVMNIYLREDPTKLRWFDAPADNPWKEFDDPSEGRLMTRIGVLFREAARVSPNNLPLFDLDQNIPVSMLVQINKRGETRIPIWLGVKMLMDDGKPKIVNLRNQLKARIPDWSEDMLDEVVAWAKETDDHTLPELTDIPAVMENGRICELLGLSTGGAPVSRPPAARHSAMPSGSLASADPSSRGVSEESPGDPFDAPGPPPGARSSTPALSSLDLSRKEAVEQFRRQLAAGAKPPSSLPDAGSGEGSQGDDHQEEVGGPAEDEPPF